MTETVKFSLIGKEDLNIGFGTFEVTLADGRVVTLSQVDIAYLVSDAFTEANLPVSVAGVGRLGRVTDNARGLWMHGRASKWFSLLGEVVYAEDFDTFADAITDIGSTERTLLINRSMEVTGIVTVNANTTLWFVNQGALNITNGVTVTHNGLTKAPRRQIIEGNGLIEFGGGQGSIRVYPEWWGAVVDNSADDTNKVQAAITALSTTIGGIVEISPFTLLTAGDLTIGARILVEDYANPAAPVWRINGSNRSLMDAPDAGMGALQNLGLAASVASNALTVALKDGAGSNPSSASQVTIPFRDDPVTTGEYTDRTVTAALSVVLSDGSTLGFAASEFGRIHIWAIYGTTGGVELALSRHSTFDETGLIPTTAEGGSGGADSASTLYSTTARTAIAVRLIGYVDIVTGGTAGQWGTAPVVVQVMAIGIDRTPPKRGHIDGLDGSRDADTDHDVNTSAGEATDRFGWVTMRLPKEITKRVDGGWNVGDDGGGLDTGSVGNSDYYYRFLIMRPDTGVVDVILSLSATAPTLPTNYYYYRYIGFAGLTDGSANFATNWFQDGELFFWVVLLNDVNAGNPGTSAVTPTLTVPADVVVWADITFTLQDTSHGADTNALVSSISTTDTAPSSTLHSVRMVGASADFLSNSVSAKVRTNTSGQIRYRLDNSDAGITAFIVTRGWTDERGRNA